MNRLMVICVLAATAALGGCVVAPGQPVGYYPPAVSVYAAPPPVVVYPRPYYGYGNGYGYGRRGYGRRHW
jgi:hypothetical protein